MKLADGVYAFIAPIETSVVSGNSLLVVGDDGALVVGCPLVRRLRSLRADFSAQEKSLFVTPNTIASSTN